VQIRIYLSEVRKELGGDEGCEKGSMTSSGVMRYKKQYFVQLWKFHNENLKALLL